MSPFVTYLTGLAAVAAALACVWASQLRSHNANMVDPAWSVTLGALAVFFALMGNAPEALRMLLAVFGSLWALRLGVHLHRRNHGKPEDARYARYRKRWGDGANAKLFWFVEFQVVFSALLSLPFLAIAWRDRWPPAWAVVVAAAVWIVAVAGEAIADRQLATFMRDPANQGQVNRTGLWRYSRHPNYFFECLHWVTYLFLLVGSPWWWLGLIAPMTMAFLVLKLSGIPMTEAHMAQSRPAYADYMRTTSAFVPWPPKESR